ncbi:MAG TPA: PfkB family carbohydrate kinase [Pararhizobium sp.]|nr:PfkB family carbohydrate kinase [Pararhizobium sp.]
MRRNILTLADRIVASGGRISFDPNVRPELIRDEGARAALNDLTARARILLPSESDLDTLLPGRDRMEAVASLHDAGAEIVVVKLGAAGCIVSDGTRAERLAGHHVEEIDPTGAGDCFCGTFVALLEQGMAPHEAGRIANAAGALSVTRRGPMEGNSNPDQIDAFLNRGNDA